ncbi:hypothetical protein J6590_066230 [Homalodisca vitripennis]|nr:hypothetical protein J6590_066230 [Homalodisca vitripennis]
MTSRCNSNPAQYERNRRFGHLVHALGRAAGGAKLPSVGLCLNASKAESRLVGADIHLESPEKLWRACAGSFLGDPARSRASVHGRSRYKEFDAGRRTAPPIRGDNPPGSCQISLLRDDTPAVPGHAAVRTESARQTRPAKHDCTEGDAVCTTGDAMSVPVVDTHPSLGVLPHRLDNLDFVEKSPRDILGQDKCPLARDVGHSRFSALLQTDMHLGRPEFSGVELCSAACQKKTRR